jgi:hypothetical protein
MIRGQIQLPKDVGENIVHANVDVPVQLDCQLIGQDALIVLCQTRLQPEIQLAPTHGLRKEVCDAFFIVRTLLGIECRQTLRKSVSKAHLLSKSRQLVGAHLDRDLDARFPAPFFYVKHTDLHIGLAVNRFRPEEERNSVGRGVSSEFRNHGRALYHDSCAALERD